MPEEVLYMNTAEAQGEITCVDAYLITNTK
jgi:hypothetical protein